MYREAQSLRDAASGELDDTTIWAVRVNGRIKELTVVLEEEYEVPCPRSWEEWLEFLQFLTPLIRIGNLKRARPALGRSEVTRQSGAMTANWRNRTLWTGDNLDIMRGMNSESVDLICLDPPFNSNRDYAAPIGSEAAGAAFKDTWTLSDVDEAWHGEIADREPALYAIIDAAGLAHGKGMKSLLDYDGGSVFRARLRYVAGVGAVPFFFGALNGDCVCDF